MRTSRASLEKAMPDDPDRISPTIFWTVACRRARSALGSLPAAEAVRAWRCC
jgi:hypothetical protein